MKGSSGGRPGNLTVTHLVRRNREYPETTLLRPADTPHNRVTDERTPVDNAPAKETANPFAVFSEWSGDADERAYRDL